MRDDATGKTFNYMHLDPKLWDERGAFEEI
jgi:hypothetical protein